MASASKRANLTSSNGSLYYLTASFNENSTSIANNTSSVTCTATLQSTNSYWTSSYNSTLEIYWHDNRENYDRWVASVNMTTIASGGSTSASGTITVTHNADGKISGYAYAKFTKGGTSAYCPNSGGVTTDWTALTTIPRQANITSAPDFNDESNPTIQYSNSAGNSVTSLDACISLTGSTDDISYRAVSKTGTSYTFELTEAERNVLRNACPNSNTLNVKFYLRTVIGGNTYYSTSDKKMTIINGNPTFASNNVTYQDSNNTTVAVTQNNQHLVQNLSNLLVSIASATAKKGSSIDRYESTINGTTRTITSAGNIDYGVINSGEDLTLTVKAIDTRGNTTTVTKTVVFLSWVLPTGVISLKRKNNYEDETYLKVNATYSSVDSKNTITIQYQRKKTTDTNYSALTTIQDGVTATINLDKNYAWNFRIVITDAFGSTTYNTVLAKGKFILFVDTKKLSVGVNCFPTHNESLEVNGEQIGAMDFDKIYPIGSIYMSVNSTNPATLFGGTWQRFSNGRVLVGVDENQTEFNAVNKTGGSKEMQKHTHTQKSCTNPGNHTHNTWNYFSFKHASGGVTTTCTGEPADGRGNATAGAGGHTHTITLNDAGTGTSGNLQPYICVYIWQRTG